MFNIFRNNHAKAEIAAPLTVNQMVANLCTTVAVRVRGDKLQHCWSMRGTLEQLSTYAAEGYAVELIGEVAHAAREIVSASLLEEHPGAFQFTVVGSTLDPMSLEDACDRPQRALPFLIGMDVPIHWVDEAARQSLAGEIQSLNDARDRTREAAYAWLDNARGVLDVARREKKLDAQSRFELSEKVARRRMQLQAAAQLLPTAQDHLALAGETELRSSTILELEAASR